MRLTRLSQLRSLRKDGSIARILQNTGWLLTGKGVGAVLSLFYLAILTRTLGPTHFGQFTLILSTAQAIAIIVSFETWQIVVKYGQDHLREGGHDRLGRLFTFCIALDLCGATIGCLIAAAAAFLLGPHFGWSHDVAVQSVAFTAVMLLTIRSTPTGILRLFDRFDAGAIADTMIPIGRMIGAVTVWLVSPGITAFLIAWACAELLCAATYWGLALRTARQRIGRWSGRRFLKSRRENQGIISFLTATNISTTVSGASKQFVVLLIGFFAGAADAGLYRLANQLSTSLAKVSILLSRAIFSELARVQATQNAEQLRKLFHRTNKLVLIAGVAVAAIVLVLGKPLLLLLAGHEFAGAYPLLVLLGMAAATDLAGIGYEPLIMTSGRPRLSATIKIVNMLLLFALLTFLLPWLGTKGAAIAVLTAAITGFLMMGTAARRSIRQGRG